ncbi:MAG: hypothetical protein JXN65_06365 [Clostridia bacterium]|nr:hypothetical protein [Clostridia bacterium]
MSSKSRGLTDVQLLAVCHIIGFIIVSVFIAIAHKVASTYPSLTVRLLFPANMSPWEQGKLLVVPLSLFFFIEYFIVGKKFKNFIPVHFLVAFAIPVFLVLIYSLYSAAFGSLSNDGPQIVFSFTLLLAALLSSVMLVTAETNFNKFALLFIILYFLLNIAYIVFLFMPPKAAVFYDAVNKLYGPAFK